MEEDDVASNTQNRLGRAGFPRSHVGGIESKSQARQQIGTPKTFFDTGRVEIGQLMAEINPFSDARGKALDFGCGLGRLTRALLGHYRQAFGVDISEKYDRKSQGVYSGVYFSAKRI